LEIQLVINGNKEGKKGKRGKKPVLSALFAFFASLTPGDSPQPNCGATRY
jgi:hypothetical protein